LQVAALIARYAYPALFVGAVLEGETVLALAGLAAHRGYLDLRVVIAVAALGGFFGDQIWFELGRRAGPALVARWPDLSPGVARMQQLLAGRQAAVIFGLRFLYGMRIVGPVAMGMSGVSRRLFLTLNALGATLWGAVFAGLGYVLGETLQAVLGDLRRIELAVFAAVALAGLIVGLARRARRRRAAATPTP
jgi:membrane protein DedA with SNARE-associated domain